jgi:hypothetical protein
MDGMRSTSDRLLPALPFTSIPANIFILFAKVSAGGFHSCGVRKDGTLKCWGKVRRKKDGTPHRSLHLVFYNTSWFLGWGQNYEGQATPPDGRFVQVSSGKVVPVMLVLLLFFGMSFWSMRCNTSINSY